MRKSERALISLGTDKDLGLMKLTRQKKHLERVGKEKGWKSSVNAEAGVQPVTLETIKSQGSSQQWNWESRQREAGCHVLVLVVL